MSSTVLVNAALCIAPVVVVPMAAVTAVSGPCAGIRGAWSGLVLFTTAALGLCVVCVGWVRWARLGPVSSTVKLAKVGISIAGVAVFLLNGFFAFFSGAQLLGMLVSRIHG